MRTKTHLKTFFIWFPVGRQTGTLPNLRTEVSLGERLLLNPVGGEVYLMREAIRRPILVVGRLAVSVPITIRTAPAQLYKTDIPPGITIADSVDTRLGTLKFVDGFLDDATVEKVYDNLDFQRGVQAFLTSMSGASLVAMRKGIRSFRSR
jgi:hypothetical protein